jgi:MscS family membrane protein
MKSLIESLPDWLRHEMLGISVWQLMGLLLLIFIALVFRRLVLFFFSRWLQKLIGRVLPSWRTAIDRSGRPLSGLMVALVLSIGLPLLEFAPSLARVFDLAVRCLAVGSGVWLIYRQIDVLSAFLGERAASTETKLDDQLVPLVRRTLKAFVLVIGGIFILQNLNVDVASLVAGLGLGGLAFALAAKDTLSNFFGSLVIFIDRPFQIGDWVVIGRIEGMVEAVGFRTTRVRTFYNSLITVPNMTLTGTAIDNMGARHYRRLKLMLGLTYDTTPDQMQAFVEGVRAILRNHPDTRKDYYEVHFNNYGAYALEVLLYAFVKVPAWSDELRAKHEIFLSILKLAKDLNVGFAFPTQTLHVAETPDHPFAPPPAPSREKLTATVDNYGPKGKAGTKGADPLTNGYPPGA